MEVSMFTNFISRNGAVISQASVNSLQNKWKTFFSQLFLEKAAYYVVLESPKLRDEFKSE